MEIYTHIEMVIDMVEIKSETQFDELLGKSEELVFVDFWATWCGPCKALKPVLEKVCKDKNVTLFEVNVDDNKTLAQRYQVNSIPVILLFKWGEMRSGAMGNKSEAEILQMIDEERNPPKEEMKTE